MLVMASRTQGIADFQFSRMGFFRLGIFDVHNSCMGFFMPGQSLRLDCDRLDLSGILLMQLLPKQGAKHISKNNDQ